MNELVCSWSGGKESALALELATTAAARPRALLTMLTEDGERSRSHGLHRSVLTAQAAALGIPLLTAATTWANYTTTFVRELTALSIDAKACVFGDIDIDEHRRWCQRAAQAAGMTALHPLWQRPRRDLLDEMLARGWQATIVTVRADVLDPSLLGRVLDQDLIAELEAAGVDSCGENGEYHTLITDGPLFRAPIPIAHRERLLRSGCWYLDLEVLTEEPRPAPQPLTSMP
ncbi:MAG TPA: diphthine--ammonia ligase [Solirubrobacteraceae bacterium]|nr:diphthine--ammonia ligase [Solirubrobacteraceae bacterium]